MLLVNYTHTSSLQSVNVIPIGAFEWCEHSDITRLQFVKYMRGKAAQDNIVLHHEFKDFKALMRSKSIAHQDPWLSMGLFTSLRIKNTL